MPSFTPGLIFTVNVRRRRSRPGAVTLRARLLDHGAVAATARARLRKREESLPLGDDAAAVALRADDRRRAGLRARTAAIRARDGQLDRDLRLGAAQRVLEREPHLGLDVGAAHRLRRARTAARRRGFPKIPPRMSPRSTCQSTLPKLTSPPPGPGAAAVRRAEAVVVLPLLLVGEDVVRGLHLLEALLRGLVAGVRVGVVLARELAVRLLDLVLRSALLDAERVVQGAQISLLSYEAAATITRAGRTTRSPSL